MYIYLYVCMYLCDFIKLYEQYIKIYKNGNFCINDLIFEKYNFRLRMYGICLRKTAGACTVDGCTMLVRAVTILFQISNNFLMIKQINDKNL